MAVLVFVVLLVICEFISKNRCGARQDLSDDVGYYHTEKQSNNYLKSPLHSQMLARQPYSKYYDGGAVHSEILGDDDESYSFDDGKSDPYELVKHDKHAKKTRDAKLYNSKIKYLDDSEYIGQRKDNENNFFRIARNAKKNNGRCVLRRASGNGTHLKHGQKQISIKNYSQSNESENKSKPYNNENKNSDRQKIDRLDSDDEDEYSADNNGNYDTKDNTESSDKTESSNKIHSAKIVTSPAERYSAEIIKPTEIVDFPKVSEDREPKHGLDRSKNKSEKIYKGKKKDLEIIQPIQDNPIENNGKKVFISIENSQTNDVFSNGKEISFKKKSNVNTNMNEYSGKKTSFTSPNNENIINNKQDEALLNTRSKEAAKILKNWPDHDLENRPHVLNDDHGMSKLRSKFVHNEANPRGLSNPNYSSSNNRSGNKEVFVHKHKSKNYQFKHSPDDQSFNNFRKHEKFSGNQVSSSGSNPKHFYKSYNSVHKSSSNSDVSTENDYPQLRERLNENLFISKNEKNYPKDPQNGFSSGEVNNNVYYRQQNSIPVVIKNNEKYVENSLSQEVDPAEKLSRNHTILSNESCNETMNERNYIENQNNDKDISANKEFGRINEKRLPSLYSTDNKGNLEVDALYNISEFGPRLHRPVSNHADFYHFLELKNNQISDPKKRSILKKPNVSLKPFHHYSFAEETGDYAEEIANFSGTNLKSSNTIYDYDFGEKVGNIRKNNFHDDVTRRQSNSNDEAFLNKGNSELTNSLENPDGGKFLQRKNTRKKIGKSSVFSEIEDGVSNSDNTVLATSVKKSKQKKIDLEAEDSSHDKNAITVKTDKHLSSKKCMENGASNFGNRLSSKIIGKQCHPPAGPPKFRWCSEDSDPVKDQEYEDALKGKVALRIVEVILAKVQKSSKMTSDFGFCKNQKRPATMDEENECIAQNSILKSEDLKEIMLSLEKMSYKGCNQLPPKLKEFLEWLVKVKHVRSVHSKGMGFGKHSHSNCSFGDSAFLFHRYSMPSSNVFPAVNMGHQFAPYETVVDYDYDNLGSGKKFDNKRINSERNIIREDNNLISDYLKPEFMGKYRRHASERKSRFLEGINPYSVNRRNDFLSYLHPTNVISNGLNDDRKVGNTYDYYNSKRFNPLSDFIKFNANDNESANENFNNKIMLVSKNYEDKNTPFEKFQSDSGSNGVANLYKNSYSSLNGIRQKRNNRKLKLQELFLDKYPEIYLNRKNYRNKQNFIDTFDVDHEVNTKKRRDFLNHEERRLDFDTPVVFRVPDEYEI